MARKTKKKPEPLPEEQHEPNIPSLTESELLRLKVHEAEQRAATAEANLRIYERNAYLRKIDPEGKLAAYDQEIRDLIGRATASRGKYAETITKIESRVGIKMADYSYDDETGALVPVTG